MRRGFRDFIYALTLVGNFVFFSINSLLGIEYEGMEQGGNSYLLFTVIIFASVLMMTVKERKRIINKTCFIIPVVVSILYFIESLIAQTPEQASMMKQSFSVFWAFSVPCIFVGIILGNTKEVEGVFKWIDFFALIISLGCLASLPHFIASSVIQFGGGNYQQLSYTSAIVCSIFLYNILNNNKYRFKFLSNKLYSYFTVLLMVACVLCILISGGRGGFLLLMINIVILFFSRRKWILKNLVWVIVLVPVVFLVLSLFNNSITSEIMDYGGVRIKESFFSGEGVDLSKTGREEVYKDAQKMIKNNPFGYGFFRSYAIMGTYPHNLFLEVLLDGGFILLTAFICLLLKLIKKTKIMIKDDPGLDFFLVLISYPIIMLQATSTYLWSGLFWFGLTFILSYRPNRIKMPCQSIRESVV